MGVAERAEQAPGISTEVRHRLLLSLVHRLTKLINQAARTTVVVIDDMHWIDAGSKSYIDQIAEAVENTYCLLLVNFRPEYDIGWTRKSYYQQLPLVPLNAADAGRLVSELLGSDPSLAPLTARLLAWTGGNPFYAEEVIQMLIGGGHLEGRRGRYKQVSPIEQIHVPDNVRAVIAARIDRLDDSAKRVLQQASVIGKIFSVPILEATLDFDNNDLADKLETLRAGEFIHQLALYPVIEYAFKHPLLHDVAYETQLRSVRSEAHAHVATALARQEAEDSEENAALLAHHWGLADRPAEAIKWHRKTALRSLMSDAASSFRHWSRVRELSKLLGSGKDTLSMGADACARMLNLGWQIGLGESEAQELFVDGKALAQRSNDFALVARLNMVYGASRCINLGITADNVEFSKEAVAIAREIDDRPLHASACMTLVNGYVMCGCFEQAIKLADQTLAEIPAEAFFGAGNISPASTLVALRAVACGLMARDPARALQDLRSTITGSTRHGYIEVEVFAHSMSAWLHALLGQDREALEHAQAVIPLAAELGSGLAGCHQHLAMGRAQLACGDHRRAEQSFAALLELAEERRTGGVLLAAGLAGVATTLLVGGNTSGALDEAEKSVTYCRERKVEWDLSPWLILSRARIAAGDKTGAETLLDQAHALIERTGAMIFRPFLHEYRAAFAEKFLHDRDVVLQRDTALRLFAELGADGHVERLRRTV